MSMRSRWDGGLIQGFLSDLSYMASMERLGHALIKRVLWRAPGYGRRLALTFDDGPSAKFTPQVLDILRTYGIPATFFVVGQYAAARPKLIEEILAGGNEIANHTYTHPILLGRGRAYVANELEKTHSVLQDLGASPVFFRPPMGLFSPAILNAAEKQGYQTVVGDVYPRDPHRPGADVISRRILARTRNGSVIILHDGGNFEPVDRTQTVASLKTIIPALKDRGFSFLTLSQLFDPNHTLPGDGHD